ncbi:uncharacterized protein V1513DRAFT_449043 [Lipomyces chichibuensis]|uniref:uncharacterized protein n=1 Tax=Lipomyces chichibuensis TaxID=1546026 RepID=UPI0033431E7C
MADNAAVASLLAALTQRAQQQQQQQGQPQAQPAPYGLASPPTQYSAPQQVPTQFSHPFAQLLAQQQQQPAGGAANATAAALAAVAAAAAAGGPGSQPAAGAYSLPAPTNSGYLDLATLLQPDSSSLTVGEYYSRVTRGDSKSYDDRHRDDDRGRFRDRDRGRERDRDRNNDRRRKRSPTPPRLREDERCRECSPKREPSPGGTRTESLIVKTPFVGLIIGRGGETLKRIEHESGARVQFITNGKEGPERLCNISGGPENIYVAKTTVIQMIENATLDTRGRPLQNGTGRSGV